MSELDSRYVKRGYWVNQSKGSIMGKTITTDTRSGTIIVALLAVCTGLATSHLWSVLTFLYHQYRADGKPSDGLLRQQQAILRTLPTPTSLLADSCKLWFRWGRIESKKRRDVTQQLLPQIVAGFLFVLGSLTAAIFSSYVVTSSDLEVLIRSPFCSKFYVGGGYSLYYRTRVQSLSSRYTDECYEDKTPLPVRCSTIFTRSAIPFVEEKVAYPFDPRICASPSISFDTGLLDLNDALGFNLEDGDKIRYRQKTACTLLSLENRTRRLTYEDYIREYPDVPLGREPLQGEDFLLYSFGTRQDLGNVTHVLSLATSNVTRGIRVDGQLHAPGAELFSANAIFKPLPEMMREDADVNLMSVRKYATKFYNEVDDLLFAAHRELTAHDVSGENFTWYLPDDPLSVIGCTEQYQFCIGQHGDSCTALEGFYNTFSTKNIQMGNEIQQEILTLLNATISFFGLASVLNLNASSLAGPYGQLDTLPDYQWRTEFRYMVANTLALMQIVLTDYAVGPRLQVPDGDFPYEYPPPSDAGKRLCQMIKMRKVGGFVNISVFGLAFIITFSVVVTLLDLVLLRFLIYLSKFRKALSPRLDRWIQDDVFQLQRRAYEAEGQGTWTDIHKEIPITTGDDVFTDLVIGTLPPGRLCLGCSNASSSSPAREGACDNESLTSQISKEIAAFAPNHLPAQSMPPDCRSSLQTSPAVVSNQQGQSRDHQTQDIPDPAIQTQAIEVLPVLSLVPHDDGASSNYSARDSFYKISSR